MRILMLSPYPPYPPHSGGALRIYHLLRGLVNRYSVTLLTFAPDAAAIAALQPLRVLAQVDVVRGPPPRSLAQRVLTTLFSPLPDMALRNASTPYATKLAELLTRTQFDAVLAESIEMAPYLLQAARRGFYTILDEFNAEYLLQRRAALNDLRRLPRPTALIGGSYSLIQWLKLAIFERRVLETAQRVLVVSPEDAAALRRLAPRARLELVPNGVDCSHFAPPTTPPPSSHDLVFIGTLDYRPNVDAVLWFAHEVLPLIRAQLPDMRLRLIGRRPHRAVAALHDGETVIVTGEVTDTRPALASAAAVVIPMRIGGGSRLKLLEALAMAAPVVCTTMGAEGIPGLRDGEHLLLADTPAAMAQAVLRLVIDRSLAWQLGQAGRAFVCAHYDWSQIVPRLIAVLAD
ncbi:MAG: glycosyl transferase family 1 [Chloroflexus sp.]|uniref:glycosyltransferase family 4 protein n=1 Tax=Chloroflexus sp. TaxID=1904827 RepID=UPI0021DE4F71|nr:glycosyltransferase family 4 protein [Chloroflexus sp.]GIV89212.1 MAG: glycosyl transferase family 1 [Chloroflexus sp.]